MHQGRKMYHTRGNVTACVRGRIYNFFFEGRKMSFRGPYRGHKILNVFCGLGLTFSISRPLYGPQKFILRPEDKKLLQDLFLGRKPAKVVDVLQKEMNVSELLNISFF